MLADIFYVYMDDILTSVDMMFEQPGSPEMIVHYDEEFVHQIIKAAVNHNIHSRPSSLENSDDPFNLSPLIEEYSVYERRFKKWLGTIVKNGWLNFVKRQNEIARDTNEEVTEIIEEVTGASIDREQLMIVPWRDLTLASVVEVANYYSENVHQEEPVEESQDIVPIREATSIIPVSETAEKSESSSLGLSLSDEEIVEELVKPEEVEMMEKAIAEADAEEKRRRELQIEEDRLKTALLQTEEEEQVYKRRKIASDAEKTLRASTS